MFKATILLFKQSFKLKTVKHGLKQTLTLQKLQDINRCFLQG